MNVIIIDDQPDVVKGILSGVDWDELRIQNRYHAYNIFEAKKIFDTCAIQIMLCDIEMPMGSGLELFEWVRKHYPDVKCVFLTSHAEFSYAQQALKMGCFDYLLQPAKYSDIERILQKAIAQIYKEELAQKYYQLGYDLRKEETNLVESILRDYFIGIQTNNKNVVDYMHPFSIDIQENTPVMAILVQVIEWENERVCIESDLLTYALRNIINELLEPYEQNMFLVMMDHENFVVLLYGKSYDHIDEVKSCFDNFIQLTKQYLQCSFACYLSDETEFSELPDKIKKLYRMKQNNVARRGEVFFKKIETKNSTYQTPDMKRWQGLLDQGYGTLVKQEIHEYLHREEHSGILNIDFLSRFHQDFLQIFFTVLEKCQLKAHEVFNEECNYKALLESYTSLEEMIRLVDFTIDYIQRKTTNMDAGQSQMDKVIEYIHQNIQKNITRTEIAEYVYLNPEYLSRLFKKEQGISLTEFILQEKMKIAESLLKNTNFSVGIIASKVGYANFSHFAQAFKKIYGVSPSDYRHKQ